MVDLNQNCKAMIPVNKLMIIDDDELSNYITGKIVEHSGLAEKADSFYSAKAALKYLKTNSSMRQGDHPDIIFLDLNLYDMKGWDFLSEYIKLKENYRRKITLFLLTNSIAEKDREQSKQFPCIKGYLQKPLTMAMIYEIELYLSKNNEYVYKN